MRAIIYDAQNYIPFSFDEIADELFIARADCSGNSLATGFIFNLPTVTSVTRYQKVRVTARWVDINNFAFVLAAAPPFLTQAGNIPVEYSIFADGPNGNSITVFLSGGGAFVDGTTSLSIPTGKGKILTGIHGNIWGVLG